jgi:acetyl esterase/lipase
VLYFHGGAYIYEIAGVQWRAAAQIAVSSDFRMVVPIYPLAPLSTATATTQIATAIARDVLLAERDQRVALMGDSAGGGLALAVAQMLSPDEAERISTLVLISPWLDAAVDNPDAERTDPSDPMLHQPGLQQAGRLYAGALRVDDPRVSPLYGALDRLPPTLLLSGTADILHPDSERLWGLARNSSNQLRYYRLPHGQHVFAFLPTREGKAARVAIADHLLRHT